MSPVVYLLNGIMAAHPSCVVRTDDHLRTITFVRSVSGELGDRLWLSYHERPISTGWHLPFARTHTNLLETI